jgi:two component regulator with propeller domain
MKQDKHFRLCVIGAFALLFLANSNCTYVKHEKDEKYTHVKVLKPPQIVNAGSPSVRVAGAPRNTDGSKPRIVSADFFAHISDGDIERWCSIDDLLIDKNNNLWVNYSVTEETKKDNGEHHWRVIEAGVCCCSEGKDYKVYSSKEGLCDDVVHCMFGDSIGNIWFGTRNGVTRFDGENFTTYDTTQGLLNNYVCCIAEDRNRNLWFGTVNGASYFNGKYFMNYTKEEGLIGGNVLGLVEDNDGDIWFGTQGNGAICFNGKSFTIYTTDQGLPSNGFFFDKVVQKLCLKHGMGIYGLELIQVRYVNLMVINSLLMILQQA